MRLAAPLTAVAMLTCSPVAWGQPAPGPATPLSHPDPRDAPSSPLDVRDVSFGQRGIPLVLRIRMQQAWAPRKLNGTRSVCVLISRSSTLAHPKRLCVRLRGKRTLRTTVLPSALGLPLGPVWWAVESRWDDVVDRVPDSGALETSIRAFAAPPCFGAAARASAHPCRNPALAKSAYPAPEDAAVWPSAACTPLRAAFDPCAFGVSRRRSRATVVLVGDSHAVHWRAALEVVAQVKRWRGISITRPGCPFSTQVPISPALGPAACVAQHAATIAWLRAHPAIRTVFVSDWAEPPSGPQGGIGGYGGGEAGYGVMLHPPPPSVPDIYVS